MDPRTLPFPAPLEAALGGSDEAILDFTFGPHRPLEPEPELEPPRRRHRHWADDSFDGPDDPDDDGGPDGGLAIVSDIESGAAPAAPWQLDDVKGPHSRVGPLTETVLALLKDAAVVFGVALSRGHVLLEYGSSFLQFSLACALTLASILWPVVQDVGCIWGRFLAVHGMQLARWTREFTMRCNRSLARLLLTWNLPCRAHTLSRLLLRAAERGLCLAGKGTLRVLSGASRQLERMVLSCLETVTWLFVTPEGHRQLGELARFLARMLSVFLSALGHLAIALYSICAPTLTSTANSLAHGAASLGPLLADFMRNRAVPTASHPGDESGQDSTLVRLWKLGCRLSLDDASRALAPTVSDPSADDPVGNLGDAPRSQRERKRRTTDTRSTRSRFDEAERATLQRSCSGSGYRNERGAKGSNQRLSEIFNSQMAQQRPDYEPRTVQQIAGQLSSVYMGNFFRQEGIESQREPWSDDETYNLAVSFLQQALDMPMGVVQVNGQLTNIAKDFLDGVVRKLHAQRILRDAQSVKAKLIGISRRTSGMRLFYRVLQCGRGRWTFQSVSESTPRQ